MSAKPWSAVARALESWGFTPIKVTALLVAAALGWATGDWRLPQYLAEINFDEYARQNLAPRDDRIVLIDIDADSYAHDFAATSPMRQETVEQLIRIAGENGAATIGLDVDTSHWGNATAGGASSAGCTERSVLLVPHGIPVVCGSVNEHAHVGLTASRIDDAEKRNETGIIRTHPGAASGRRSLSDEVARRYCPTCEVTDGKRYIRFVERCQDASCAGSPMFLRYPAGRLLRPSPDSMVPRELFKGRIVLIGGTAPAFGDVHQSPFGPESGLELHAELVSSRLRGGITPIPEYVVVLLDLVIGILVVLAQHAVVSFFCPRKDRPTLVASLDMLVAFVAALGVTWLAFLAFWLGQVSYSALVVLLGMLIGDWLEARLATMKAPEPHKEG